MRIECDGDDSKTSETVVSRLADVIVNQHLLSAVTRALAGSVKD